MRIGEINANNYQEYLKMLESMTGRKIEIPSLEDIMGSKGSAEAIDYENYSLIEGMNVKGLNGSYQKIVPVSDEARQTMIDMARREFIEGFGMSDGIEQGDYIRAYVQTISPETRSSSAWTLQQIYSEEAHRLLDIVYKNDPTWKFGQPFDPSIFDDYLSANHLDKMV